jgi:hypothetical protein
MSVNATIEELPTTSEQPSVQEVQTTTGEGTTNTDDITSKNVASEASKEIPITEVVVDNDIIGLNLLIAFGQIAHKRGAYNIEETAKLHETIQYFTKKMNATIPPPAPTNA